MVSTCQACGKHFETLRGLERHQPHCDVLRRQTNALRETGQEARRKRRGDIPESHSRPLRHGANASFDVGRGRKQRRVEPETASGSKDKSAADLGRMPPDLDVQMEEANSNENQPPDGVGVGTSAHTPANQSRLGYDWLEHEDVGLDGDLQMGGEDQGIGPSDDIGEPGESYSRAAESSPESMLASSPRAQVASTSEGGRPRRINRRIPARYRDILPAAPTGLPAEPRAASEPPDQPPAPRRVTLHVREQLETAPDAFGLYKKFYDRPSYDPDGEITLEDLAGLTVNPGAKETEEDGPPAATPGPKKAYYPFPNHSTFMISNWYFDTPSGERSGPDYDRLIATIADPRFIAKDVAGFSAAKRDKLLDQMDEPDENKPPLLGTWKRNVPVPIQIPEGKKEWTTDTGRTFMVPGFHHRSIIEIIRTVFSSQTNVHFTPFQTLWKPSASRPTERVYGDIYNSQAFYDAHHEVKNDPNLGVPGCTLERVIAALMLWSDSTHLAQFGTAKLWPIYLFFGNLSKWFRGKPNSHSCHHLAYIQSLPDFIQDFIREITGEAGKGPMLTHCRRELIQAIWGLLLDEEFMTAYKHGIVIECADGIKRRFFPRFFTYSADYPEKMLMLSLRDKGTCPCPRCLVTKQEIYQLGLRRDRTRRETRARTDLRPQVQDVALARKFIYEKTAYAVNSKAVDNLLKPKSLVPTVNTFSSKLAPFKFNKYNMFVVDLLHEVELGVWKAIFTHLIRLLNEVGLEKVHELNKRYRAMATFGRDTIRRFANNVSEMKKLAARDFEDMLQCAMPAFEGLFPEPHENIIQELLFTMASWHSLAKLRMHTDSTLARLDTLTTQLGQIIRKFAAVTCTAFVTHELPREIAARARRRAKKAQHASAAAPVRLPATEPPKTKPFNLSTPKLHALGDYVSTIRYFGTTDSYSTQTGELEHRTAKRRYPRVSKANPALGMTKVVRRETMMREITAKVVESSGPLPARARSHHVSALEAEKLPYTDPKERYHISPSQRHPLDIGKFLRDNSGDPAVKNFYPRLKDHLLGRFLGMEYDGDETEFTEADRDTILLRNNRLYRHKACRVNFTTYDVRRSQDSLNPRTSHCDVLVRAREDPDSPGYHPFWYARILGIFHVNVGRIQPGTRDNVEWKSMAFLWVRWFGRADTQDRHPINPRRMDRLGFVTEDDDTEPFGFLDPANIVRACHLIPAFSHGRTSDLLGPSVARSNPDENDDWLYYYVNRFVDRDMMMLFLGGGVGHSIRYDAGPSNTSLDPSQTADEDEDEPEMPPQIHGQRRKSFEDGVQGSEEETLEGGAEDGSESESESESEGSHSAEDDPEDDDEQDPNISDDGYGSAG